MSDLSIPALSALRAPDPVPVAPVPQEQRRPEPQSGLDEAVATAQPGDPDDFVRRALSERAAIRISGAELRPAPEIREHPVIAQQTPQTQTVVRELRRQRGTEEDEREALELPIRANDQRTQSAVAPHAGGLSHAAREPSERGEPVEDEHLLPKEQAAQDSFTQDGQVEASADDPLVTRFAAS